MTLQPIRKFCIAPMLDWTDRHCRYFHRKLTRHALLYSEMVTTGALLYGDIARHLDFDQAEQPVALQLGGSEPAELAHAAKLGQQWGYAEINLNCGCPSERVQRGAFGACLMAEPQLVADCVKAMQDAVDIPVTVKHRIGIDQREDYDFVAEFVGRIAETGCRTFIVHARNAVLKGLSPKENREIPPLKYEYVYRLKREFPHLEIILNGGIREYSMIDEHLLQVDGVMIGRQAYHEPYWLAEIDRRYFGVDEMPSRESVLAQMQTYLTDQGLEGLAMRQVIRHMLGLFNGLPGARRWRQRMSDIEQLRYASPSCLLSDMPIA
ncbi:tRNA dihydrouridine(20/20a) synthase DusA [Parvibium lacunae]|uniref:tRNA-dihydrouridine(20/20a) synthase n=1 Tax=Parvibium lacunae TaxID=1888893 RepID=A0A368L6N7_9BURK|nr:tRNA dihydrouridine(20/20a) synthase DusA [Parvibium lacunae]RCS59325.1 tRNA dihydrouridine(20/20a) synthase DusA [Parvibium lacunae]